MEFDDYKPWPDELADLLVCSIDEHSFEYEKELKNRNLENRIIQLESTSFKCYKCAPNIIIDQEKECYNYIDTNIYNAVHDLLKKHSIESSTNDICRLLKRAYCKDIISKINHDIERKRKEIDRNFKKLMQFIDKDVHSITIKSNKGECYTESNKQLSKLILRSFKDKILESPYIAEFTIMRAENDASIAEPILIIDELIFNLVLYIQTRTAFAGKTNNRDIVEKVMVSNALMDLVFTLIDDAEFFEEREIKTNKLKRNRRFKSENIINENNEKHRFYKNSMRLRLKRYIEKFPTLRSLFSDEDPQALIESELKNFAEDILKQLLLAKKQIGSAK